MAEYTHPLLNKKAWADNRISSGSKLGLWGLWGFALVWSAISFPLIFAEGGLAKVPEKPEILFALLFPLIGVLLIVAALVNTRRWLRFGEAPLSLDPFPASLGGQAGGHIDLGMPYSRGAQFEVRLSCMESAISGSGKNRKRREKVLWQTEGFCYTEPGAKGMRLSFLFDLPEDLPESEDDSKARYHLWRVHVNAKLEGPDFDRNYVIPVFRTEQQASSIHALSTEHVATQERAEEGVDEIAVITQHSDGVELYFPPFRRPLSGILAILFGSVFTAIGILVPAGVFFSFIFLGVGSVIVLFGLYSLCKALRVKVSTQGVMARRFLLAIPLTTRRMSVSEIQSLTLHQAMTSQSGNRSTVHYQVKAIAYGRQKVTIAERLTSRAEADSLLALFALYLRDKVEF